MQTIVLAALKGGVFKSLGSSCLAAIGHMRGRATRVLDTDVQNSLVDWFHARQPGSRLDGLAVVGAQRAFSLPKLRALSKGADLVVIDTPPRADAIVSATLLAADVVVVPARPGGVEWWSLATTVALIDQADDMRASLGLAPVRRCFVVNGVTPRTRLAAQFFDAVSELDGEVYETPIPNRVAYPETFAEGESVSSTRPGSAADDEMRSLYAFVTGDR